MSVEFDQVTFFYPGAESPALNGISLEIPGGSFTGVIGANNSGKSSLCAALAGIVPQMIRGRMTGAVRIDGTGVSDRPTGALSGIVGMVLQVPAHQMTGIRYTVFEEAAFGLENLGLDRGTIRERVGQALDATGLTELAGRSPFHLSGGQQQRLAIASALAADPDIFVLDEPTTFLDPAGTARVFDILSRLHRRGKTIVIAEHRLEWLAEYADRILVLNRGEVVMDGPPETVLTAPLIREAGLSWTRYTKAAMLAKGKGLWPADRPLPASFAAAVEGFEI